jgi:predicted ArsR family transcriptional regulator
MVVMTTILRGSADRAPGLGPTRTRVLGTLQDLRAPATVADVAERLDIHPNTARFHLDALVSAGLVERAREQRRRPGRPQVHYSANRSAPDAGHRSFRLLAEILTRHLSASSADAHGEAVEAGRSYGRLVAGPGPGPVAADAGRDAVSVVLDQLDEMGFASRPSSETKVIEVTNCSFLEVAEGHLGVVCAVHHGLMDELLAAAGAPTRLDRLDPLVGPSRCLAHLRPASDQPGEVRMASGSR